MDTILFLETLFKHDDQIWIGERDDKGIFGTTIRFRDQWISYFRNGGKIPTHIILNPLTGMPAPKKSGDGETFRGDGNVATYRFCMAEFDGLNREDQIRFWSKVELPICALIDSGGKSIHAWLDVSKLTKVETPEQWQSKIKGHLYDRMLIKFGVDAACSNPSRLSRLPGHYRNEKLAWQRLLWLSPEGRMVIS